MIFLNFCSKLKVTSLLSLPRLAKSRNSISNPSRLISSKFVRNIVVNRTLDNDGPSSLQTKFRCEYVSYKKFVTSAQCYSQPLNSNQKENIVTVPNILTASRFVMAPVLSYLIIQNSFSYACGLFVIAGITDFLDGQIARKFPNQATACGSFMDPLADKVMLCTLYGSLSYVSLIPVSLMLLVISRDVFLISAAMVVRFITLPVEQRTFTKYFDISRVSAEIKPTFISKLNTALQLSLVAVTLASPLLHIVDHPIIQCLWYLTAATTISSGVHYVFAQNTFRALQNTTKR